MPCILCLNQESVSSQRRAKVARSNEMAGLQQERGRGCQRCPLPVRVVDMSMSQTIELSPKGARRCLHAESLST